MRQCFTLMVTTTLFLQFFLTSCAVYPVNGEGGEVSRHYFGYVKILEPKTTSKGEKVYVRSVKALGLRVGQGVMLGYEDDKKVIFPKDCKLMIVVKNKDQFHQALNILQEIYKEGLCTLTTSENLLP